MKKNYKLYILCFLIAVLLFVLLFGENLFSSDPYTQDLSKALHSPDMTYWLGTDRYGRDYLARIIAGGKLTVFSSLFIVLMVSVIGTIIGLVCGFYEGKIDMILMRICDIFLSFPGMIFAIAIAAVFSGGIYSAVFALICISWPKYARLARSQTISVKNRPFIKSLKLSNCNNYQIMIHHILPHIYSTILVTASLDIGTMIMELAGLSFLGLGAMPPVAEWGSMMSEAQSLFQLYPWLLLIPGCAIFITVALFNLLSDTLKDQFAGD